MEVNEKDIALNVLRSQERDLVSKLESVRSSIKLIQGGMLSVPAAINNEASLSFEERIKFKSNLKSASDYERFLLVLKKEQRFMKVREIGTFIASVLGDSEKFWTTKMSRKTKYLREKGKIIKKKTGPANTDYYWGGPSWVDKSGNILESYMYKEDVKKKKVDISL